MPRGKCFSLLRILVIHTPLSEFFTPVKFFCPAAPSELHNPACRSRVICPTLVDSLLKYFLNFISYFFVHCVFFKNFVSIFCYCFFAFRLLKDLRKWHSNGYVFSVNLVSKLYNGRLQK